MTIKVIVTETFLRTYELEVETADEDTIEAAIDNRDTSKDTEPAWVGTTVFDEAGDEIFDY